jgi:TonB family protein
MRRLAYLLLLSCLVPSAWSQSGPMRPRMVFAKPPPIVDFAGGEIGRAASVELAVSVEGRVTDVRILQSSGSPAFDEKVQEYFRKWRLLPGIDEGGIPIASTLRTRYVAKGIGSPESAGETTAGPATPRQAANAAPAQEAVAAPAADDRVYDEASRIVRMRCKDFVWEYDFMRAIAGNVAPLTNEQMIKMSMAMFMVQENLSNEELKRLNRNYARTLRKVHDTCRGRPEDKYYAQVLAPELKSQLGR